MSDHEAWTELADLYLEKNKLVRIVSAVSWMVLSLSRSSYEKAAFCLEELLLVNPHYHLHHQRYAEVCSQMEHPYLTLCSSRSATLRRLWRVWKWLENTLPWRQN